MGKIDLPSEQDWPSGLIDIFQRNSSTGGQGSEWSDQSSPEDKTDWSVKKGGGD